MTKIFQNGRTQKDADAMVYYKLICEFDALFLPFDFVLKLISCHVHINPFLTNGLAHHYHLGRSASSFQNSRSDFHFLFHSSIKFLQAYRIAPDGTPRSAASHMGPICLPMSHKKDARLI